MSLESHQRKVIRAKALEVIRAAIEPHGVKAFDKNRFRPYWEKEELPAVAVYTLNEASAIFDQAPRSLKRVMDLAVELTMQAGKDVDDKLDDLAWRIEEAIHVDETLAATCSDMVLTGTEFAGREEGDLPCGAVILRFDVTYYTDAPALQPLPNYEGIDMKLQPLGSLSEDAISGKADVEE